MPMYDEEKELVIEENFVEGHKDPSVIHHFYHKLFKLGDNMNTKTAKILADKRIEFMKDFTNEFINEWKANY